jgi:endonuclease/exonuclease/phosphatase family metal-dependent hydrolase
VVIGKQSEPRILLLLSVVVVVGLLAPWVLNASRAGTRVEGCPEDCATVGERREGPLRVMSLNMLHGFPRFEHLGERLDLIAEEIRRQDADIVCLQEVPWTPHLGGAAQYLAERTGFNHLYLRANGNRWAVLFEEGEAILSRYPLRDAVFTELEPRAGFFEHRVVLGATATTPWGDVRVLVTHLTHSDPEVSQAQAASLWGLVGASWDVPSVVAGDFHAREDSPQIEALTSRWVDTYRALHRDDEGFTCCIDDLSSGPSEPLEERIDYLFLVWGAEDAARVVSSQKVLDQPFESAGRWQWASDHIGLLTAISVERSEEGGQ